MLTAESRYLRNPDFIQREVAGECLLVPIKRHLAEANSLYVLNPTGMMVWNKLDGSHAFGEIRQSLLETFEVSESQLDQDLNTLMSDLISIGAIQEKSA